MNLTTGTHRRRITGAALAVAVGLALWSSGAWATIVYLPDRATQNTAGGWDLPLQGFCPANPAATTRPLCVAQRYPQFTASAQCTAAAGSWATGLCVDQTNTTQATCVAQPDHVWNPGVCAFPAATTSAACGTAGGTWTDKSYCSDPTKTTAGTCTSPFTWTVAGVCTVPAGVDASSCTAAAPTATWTAGVCALALTDDDRNNVVCTQQGGTWVTYTSPAGTCTGSWVARDRNVFTPALITSNGPGDGCLRCHNSETQYNGPRVRDVENYLYHGHKNMARPVTVGTPWGGPPFSCTNPLYTDEESCEENNAQWNPTIYPSDDAGNAINWTNGQITVNSVNYNLKWIYGDWLSDFPRAIYDAPASATRTCSIPLAGACSNPAYVTQLSCTTAGGTWTSNSAQAGCQTNGGTWVLNAGSSYSCARCHTTGWTSDATVNTTKEPARTFGTSIVWDRNGDALNGQVNLAGGVAGDPNKSSSWDVWGITCNRCHAAVVDDSIGTCTITGLTQATCTAAPYSGSWSSATSICTVSSTPQATCNGWANSSFGAPYAAPAGWSTHNAGFTSPDAGSGYCSDYRFTALAQCNAAGAAWLTACSVAGVCSNPTFTTSGACVAGGGTWTAYTAAAACTGAGGTWYTSSCQASYPGPANTVINGYCSTNNPADNDQTTCTNNGGRWAAVTDVVRCEDLAEFGAANNIPVYASAKWYGSRLNRGQVITALCMGCHRQESSGVPYDNATNNPGSAATANPGMYLKVGPYHSTTAFVSHPHANQFLNSPHAKFTGTFNQVATAGLGTGYGSYFMADGEAANTGNGCTGCHSIHDSVVENTGPNAPVKECTECHAGPYAKDLAKINHLWGKGTPMENAGSDPASACEKCHMPGELHLFRINTDPSYSTFPAAAITGGQVVNANTAPDGTFTNAVWVDVDAACGQCHGGGSNYAKTTGSITLYATQAACTGAGGTWASNTCSLNTVVTVASSTGFAAGQKIRIADAGALSYDDPPTVSAGDFDSYIVSVLSPTTIKLNGAPTYSVSNKTVTQNATVLVDPAENRYAPYYNKADLAKVAKGMHDSSDLAYAVTFTTQITNLTVNTTASVDCGGCDTSGLTYDWTWGDTQSLLDQTVNTATHTYAAGGTYSITLDVRSGGLKVGSSTRSVTLTAPNAAPVAGANCSWNSNSWTYSVTDTSTDANGDLSQVIVNWGDGGVKSSVKPLGSMVTKTYALPGSYTISLTAYDALLQSSSYTCSPVLTPASFPLFGISGTVRGVGGTGTLANAVVILKKGGVTVKSTVSAADGTFAFASLKPASNYSITVVKPGYVFNNPAINNIGIGPDQSGLFADATSQSAAQQRSATSAARRGGR